MPRFFMVKAVFSPYAPLVMRSLAFCCLVGIFAARAGDAPRSLDEVYLCGLEGNWIMTGTLGDQPVRYIAEGKWVFDGGFMKLRMVDASSPPQYEADVFIGYDKKHNDYIAHWLDRFGAAGARVVGQGERQKQQLVIRFPYQEGAFRDTFTWQPVTESWSLLLESQRPDNTWSTFATYTLTPAPRR